MPVEQESKSSSGKSAAKSAQDEAMARLRAKRKAKEKEEAAAKAAKTEAAKAVSSAEADDVEFYKALKPKKPKGMKIDQEKETAVEKPAPSARKWEFFAEHTVAPGENLSKISEKYYGNQGYWKPLYDANQAVIGDNPNVVVAGTVLKIPKL